ncbi:NUDIX domain-containing protein [Agromyces sp. SYSU T00194]|uniref:NUDIX domain-containing protein n=1 Tax=Agromyces chitinivorans TaxID=3158560 RepID=UPI0033911E43
MGETSAGILLHRRGPTGVEVYLGHMGGPFWQGRDAAAWTIPKGTFTDEEPLDAALREFEEEIGFAAPEVTYRELGRFRYSSGKVVTVFAGESDFDPGPVRSNTFELEWPPRSGRRQAFPELDDARWVPIAHARELLVRGQRPALDALLALLEA